MDKNVVSLIGKIIAVAAVLIVTTHQALSKKSCDDIIDK